MSKRCSVYRYFTLLAFACLFFTIIYPLSVFAKSGDFEINCPYWFMLFDRAGYMDITVWCQSPRHPFGPHEMMTGDWAAAVYYDGIGTSSNQAAWLTDEFIIPKIDPTNSPFDLDAYSFWNDPNNPVWTDPNQPTSYTPGTEQYSMSSTGNDTGWSTVDDDRLEVKIHYEVVDLGVNGYSPISFYDGDGSAYVESERYVILQTYVFRNLHATETLTGLEFYQMLHGHPGTNGASSLETAGSYNTVSLDDDLSDYTPLNVVHQTGNFKYDITLWNTEEVNEDHFDWMGFSSTVEPDDYGFNYFTTGDLLMQSDIHNRNLNNLTDFASSAEIDDIAGAMMWNLPDLDPNETTSITLALMYGHGTPMEFPLPLDKTCNVDPNDCVDPTSTDPNDYTITYTIEYSNPDPNDPNYIGTINNVVLTDYLPDGINPMDVTVTGGGSYDMFTNEVTWNIGTLNPGDSNSVTVTVEVVEPIEPGSILTNDVILTSDLGWVKATDNTNVCCHDNDILYVNAYADGANTGTDWENAYKELQDALERARDCGANEIWVASGTYKAGDSAFALISDVEMYGGFKGNESSVSERDFVCYKTYLSGCDSTNTVIEAVNCNSNTILDGFTITSATGDGIACDNSDLQVKNCVIADNGDDGIYAKNDSDITVSGCLIKTNGGDGIQADTGTSNVTINNNRIRDNEDCGIYYNSAIGAIKNNWIHHNADDGIKLGSVSSAVTIRNNTICYNGDKAVLQNGGTDPAISNCIMWHNDFDGDLIQTLESFTYSCYTDPNDPNGIDANAHVPDGNDNITCWPGFAYTDPNLNNFHLYPNSYCVDKGDTYPSYTGEEDIDTEARVYNSQIDMGADEVHCEDVYNEYDFNGDGAVNYLEYASFALTWLHQDPDQCGGCDPNETDDWDPRFDFNSDYIVDVNDLTMLLDEWLWEACWLSSSEGTLMAMMSMGAGVGEESLMASAETLSISEFRIDRLSARREFEVQQAALELTLQEQIIQLEDLLQSLYEMQESQQFSARYSDQSALNESIAHLEKWLAGLYDEYEAKYQE